MPSCMRLNGNKLLQACHERSTTNHPKNEGTRTGSYESIHFLVLMLCSATAFHSHVPFGYHKLNNTNACSLNA